ncbi:hypothetical protein OSJ14_19875, partial [Mycobacterium ulcerans]
IINPAHKPANQQRRSPGAAPNSKHALVTEPVVLPRVAATAAVVITDAVAIALVAWMPVASARSGRAPFMGVAMLNGCSAPPSIGAAQFGGARSTSG